MENESIDPRTVDLHDYNQLLRFFRGQVAPRLLNDCFHWKSLLASIAIALPLLLAIGFSPADSMPVQDAASLGMSFGAVSFGACLTVAILTIGLPGAERARRWANKDRKLGSSNAYTELLFNITWSALVQLGLIFLAVASAAIGGAAGLAPAELLSWHSAILLVCTFWFGYSLVELLHVLLALSQMGVVIVSEERRMAGRNRPAPTSQGPSEEQGE